MQGLAPSAEGWILCKKDCRNDGVRNSIKKQNSCFAGQGSGYPPQKEDFCVLVVAPEL